MDFVSFLILRPDAMQAWSFPQLLHQRRAVALENFTEIITTALTSTHLFIFNLDCSLINKGI